MDDEGTGVSKVRMVFRPQPDLDVSQRAVPIGDLEDHREGKSRKMKNLNPSISLSEESTEKEKKNP